MRNAVACAAAALPVLLVVGCSSDSDKDNGSDTPSASASKSPTVAPAKYKKLPDSCKTLDKKAAKDLVPGTEDASGKSVGSGDADDSNSCLWSGLDKYDYSQLTLSFKRFDSDPSIGSGDKRAADYLKQQVEEKTGSKDNKDLKKSDTSGIGDPGGLGRLRDGEEGRQGQVGRLPRRAPGDPHRQRRGHRRLRGRRVRGRQEARRRRGEEARGEGRQGGGRAHRVTTPG